MQRQQREGMDQAEEAVGHQAGQIAMLHNQGEQIQETMNRNHAEFMAQQESLFHSAMNNAGNAHERPHHGRLRLGGLRTRSADRERIGRPG